MWSILTQQLNHSPMIVQSVSIWPINLFRHFLDIRELISVEDVLGEEELSMGPNGSLVYCMEYLANNLDWLHEQLDEGEDDYFLFDCPGNFLLLVKNPVTIFGQIELYSHLPVMRQITMALQQWNFNVCTTFILDTSFCMDPNKFISASLTTLSTQVSMMTPSVNVLSKMDLLSTEEKHSIQELLDGDLLQIHDMVNFIHSHSNVFIAIKRSERNDKME